MLVRLLKAALDSVARNRAKAPLREALAAYLTGDPSRAMERCEQALRLDAQYSDAWYWLGVLRLAHGQRPGALACFEQALQLAPDHEAYLGGLGDALLLAKREKEALGAYSRAFSYRVTPDRPECTPALRVNPVWLRHISNVTLPRPSEEYMGSAHLPSLRMAHVFAGHAANYAALLANSRCISGAINFFECAANEDAGFVFPRAALALIHTLNRNAAAAVPHAQLARTGGVELLSDCNDLCLLEAALELGQRPGQLDAFLDWSPLWSAEPQRALERLPAVDVQAFAAAMPGPLTCFIACDIGYFHEHATALILSIRERCTGTAVHVHLFASQREAQPAFEALQRQAAPLPMQASYEHVDFERYGGLARYCAHARLCRLYQWVMSNDRRVAMLDADSLVRADLRSAMERCGDIALVEARDEPIWHRILSGFSTYLPSPDSRRFLARVGGIAAHNLVQGRAPYSMDQTLLYVCARLLEAEGKPVGRLPLEFCDTTFQPHSLVWAVTSDKAAERFQELKSEVLRCSMRV